MKAALVAAVLVEMTLLVGCSPPASTPVNQDAKTVTRCPIQLRDVTADSGISFIHTDGHSGAHYIVETITAGLALLDYDGDGRVDIYLLNGAPLRGSDASQTPRNALYRNEGNWHFRDVTGAAGVGDTGYGLGVAVADYDNDGDPDIYVNNYGPNVLYRNEGDGTFTDVTPRAKVAAGDLVGAGACFLDVDADGLLDLFAGNYVNFTYENHVAHGTQGYVEYAGPRDFKPVPDFLFRNLGGGDTFGDVSAESGINEAPGTSMGMVSADYDNDGDVDLFVLNDVAGNYFFVNDGTGHFEENGVYTGAAYNMYGDELGSMGVDCADYDNDGLLDFLMTSYQGEMPVLYHNLGTGQFEDVTLSAKAGDGAYPYVNWGVGLVDLDNDGDRDIYMANGHLQDQVDQYDDTTAYAVRNVVLMNTGHGHYENVSQQCGDGVAPKYSSRGTAFDDLDNDGDLDIVVLNSRCAPTVIRNDAPAANNWFQVRLRGRHTNRDGIGAQVRLNAGPLHLIDEVHSGRGYQSAYGLRLHFGLGTHATIDRLEIRWLGGTRDVLENIPVNQCVTVIEGTTRPTADAAD